MALFIIGIILFIAAIVLFFVSRYEDSLGIGIGGVVVAIIGVVMIVASCTTVVQTKQVGIPVLYGNPGKPLGSGLHWKSPLTKVVIMDATIQDVDNAGDNPTVAKDAEDADVYVHNRVRWSIKEDSADSLYRDYKDFDRIKESLVQPEIQAAIASVMRKYEPLALDKPGYDEISTEVHSRLKNRFGERIDVHSVTISLVDVSEQTKARINQLNAERAQTEIARQRGETAEQEANANRILSESLNENVLRDSCLKMVAESEPGTFPAGFSCFGSGGSVVVPAR